MFLRLFFVLFLLTLSSCAHFGEQKKVIQGSFYLVNGFQQSPAANEVVELLKNQKVIEKTKSNETGYFFFKKYLDDGKYAVRLKKHPQKSLRTFNVSDEQNERKFSIPVILKLVQ